VISSAHNPDSLTNVGPQIIVVDLGLGNIGSVESMLGRLGLQWTSSAQPKIGGVYILPGVGSFDQGMARLKSTGWADLLTLEASTKAIIGLCLGMQLLCDGSEEGTSPGLMLLPGRFRRFVGGKAADVILKVPHMGWNIVNATEHCPPWLANAMEGSRYYFVHSFHYEGHGSEVEFGETDYGVRFPSVVSRGKLYGLQFHPEKSHKFGLQLMSELLKVVSQ
jgi:imidazole glycerol-phosphate synthase subunit HisH